MSRQTQQQMMSSVQRLFDDDFQPTWISDKERRERESITQELTVVTEFNWRQAHKESMARILANRPEPKGVPPHERHRAT